MSAYSVARARASLRTLSFALALLWFLLDQATKWCIFELGISPDQPIRITPFFNLTLGWNKGISFGIIGAGQLPPWTLAALSAFIASALIIWLSRTHDRFGATGLALIIGGALGNALDRLRHGAVTDFLDFYWADWHWPAFNIADVGVVCGAALLILETFIRRDPTAK